MADKERVAAALENSHLLEVVNQCLTEEKWMFNCLGLSTRYLLMNVYKSIFSQI